MAIIGIAGGASDSLGNILITGINHNFNLNSLF